MIAMEIMQILEKIIKIQIKKNLKIVTRAVKIEFLLYYNIMI